MGGYSLPLKNRDMFRDLKKGFQVYTLDTSDVPVFRMGNVVNVSEPRFQQPQMGQMGQYQQLQDRVIDLTVEINGSSMTYVVPESRDVAMSNNITLACSVDPIMNQLNATKRTTMTRSTIVEAAVDVADVRMGLTWVMVVEYTTTMARSMTAEWMS